MTLPLTGNVPKLKDAYMENEPPALGEGFRRLAKGESSIFILPEKGGGISLVGNLSVASGVPGGRRRCGS
jgi:hypothetical protein